MGQRHGAGERGGTNQPLGSQQTSGTAVTTSLQGKSMCLLEQTQGLHPAGAAITLNPGAWRPLASTHLHVVSDAQDDSHGPAAAEQPGWLLS